MNDPGLDAGRLRLLREVARRGSIAGAARAVGLTPSAVSQQLSVLEREAGTPLLDRSPRGVVLTGAGRSLADRAAAIADLLHAARADLDRLQGTLSGEVRVASVASAAATIVSDAVDVLREQDGLIVVVRTSEPAISLERLLADDVDIALVDEYDYLPLALPEYLVATELVVEPLVVVAPPGRFGAPVRLRELADVDWVMPPDDAACGFAVRAACRAADFEPRVRWETDDMLLLTRAVAAGHGVAVLPRLTVDLGQAVALTELAGPPLTRRLLAVARVASSRRPIVQAVMTALEKASV